MSEKKKVISVMIPTYNEEENARPIYEAVRDEIREDCPDYDYEILFIDNKKRLGKHFRKELFTKHYVFLLFYKLQKPWR